MQVDSEGQDIILSQLKCLKPVCLFFSHVEPMVWLPLSLYIISVHLRSFIINQLRPFLFIFFFLSLRQFVDKVRVCCCLQPKAKDLVITPVVVVCGRRPKTQELLQLLFLLSIYLSVCLSVCLSVYLSVYLSVCMYVYLSVYLSVCLSVCLSVYLSIYISINLSGSIFFCHSIN